VCCERRFAAYLLKDPLKARTLRLTFEGRCGVIERRAGMLQAAAGGSKDHNSREPSSNAEG